MKYRKKPVVVEAFQWAGAEHHHDYPDWLLEAIITGLAYVSPPHISEAFRKIYIRTKEGQMEASQGDYIIKGVAGELYPCKPDIFHATYEPAQEGEG